MTGISPDHQGTHDHAIGGQDRFLSSHRALAVCTREFNRLVQEVTRAAGTLAAELGHEAPVLRNSPDRCIVQLGPAALTLGWMRSQLDSVAEGRLMVIVWEGTIAQRAKHIPERSSGRAVPTAATVWEEVFAASGSSEGSWEWQLVADDSRSYESPALAQRCVEHLRSTLAAVAS